MDLIVLQNFLASFAFSSSVLRMFFMDSPFFFQRLFVFSSFFSVINSEFIAIGITSLHYIFIQSPASLAAQLNTLTAASASSLISSVACVKSADTSFVKNTS